MVFLCRDQWVTAQIESSLKINTMKRSIKKLTILCTMLLTLGMLRAQYIPLPDTDWGDYLDGAGYHSALSGSHATGWYLDTTNAAVQSATSISIINSTIHAVDGLKYFKRLWQFALLYDSNLTTISSMPDSLLIVTLSSTGLISLPPLPNSVIELRIDHTQITTIGVLPDSLQVFWCGSGPPKIFAAPLPARLALFNCTRAGLTSLPAIPPSVRYLSCDSNQLASLPQLPDTMANLDVSNNLLNSPANLPRYISARLNLDNNPGLNCLQPFSFIFELDWAHTGIACSPSYNVGSSTPAITTVPLCSSFNPNGCPFQTLVYPGDANNDRLADNTDLLNVGLAYDTTGPVRAGASIVWVGQSATDWTDTFAMGLNYKFADCNGDGIINADDTLAIMQNFGLTHTKTDGAEPWRSGIPGINVSFSQDTVQTGDTLITTFSLGDSALTVSNIYGLAFTYHYDPIVNDTSSVRFGFLSSWLGTSANSIAIYKDLTAAGQIKAAITGIDHISRSGSGAIAQMYSRITSDNINGKDLAYYNNLGYISDITAADAAGHTIQLNAGQDSARVAYEPSGLHDPDNAAIILYPNPASGHVYIRSAVQVESVMLYNALGQTILAHDVHTKTLSLDLSGIAAGAYTVAIRTQAGIKNVRFIITQ